MFRTVMALIVTLIAAIAIGAFQILNLTIESLTEILGQPDVTGNLQLLGAGLFAELMKPYTFALSGAYAPLVALGVAGFVGGLISKSPLRMLIVSVICLGLFFVGYVLLAMSAALSVDIIVLLAQDIAIDLAVSFALLFIPGMIGGSMTAEKY